MGLGRLLRGEMRDSMGVMGEKVRFYEKYVETLGKSVIE